MEKVGKKLDLWLEVIILDVKIKIVYLESELTMTRIVPKPEEDRSFSMKSIDIKFYNCSEMWNFLSDP